MNDNAHTTEAACTVAVIYGGRSLEHAVSLRSAQSLLDHLDPLRFQPQLVPVDPKGRFLQVDDHRATAAQAMKQGTPCGDLGALLSGCDVVFPLIHGPGGEDGALQGMLELLGLPYVGSGVFASALCMDKGHFKRWLVAHGLPVAPYLCLDGVRADEIESRLAEKAAELDALELPLFVKPANLGSSVGVHRVSARADLEAAVKDAARHDARVVIEAGLDARELEVAVLDDGREPALVSDVGEIVLPEGTWYDYETKYERDVARLDLPAVLPDEVREAARQLALETFRATHCRGLSRIDFFLDRKSGALWVNEVNTLPGFTSISMFPKLVEHAGVPYGECISRLLRGALAERQGT